MGYFAKVINGMVVQVIAANQEFIDTLPNKTEWVETSYNVRGGVYYDQETGQPADDQSVIELEAGRKRKNYAGIGFTYDSKRDAFIPPNNYVGWVLNEDTCLWESPIPRPTDNKIYDWNNQTLQWDYIGWYIEDGELKKEEITGE
jgi:hypothetical protein